MNDTVQPAVAIFSHGGDPHGQRVQRTLRERGVRCHVVETASTPPAGGLRWASVNGAGGAEFLDREGTWFALSEIGALWWRCVAGTGGDWLASTFGSVLTDFSGVAVSDPEATRMAENRLVQLRVARRVRLATPATLVTQDLGAVRAFAGTCGNGVVMSSVRDTPPARLAAAAFPSVDELESESLRRRPAVFQERVSGSHHLRVNCFGRSAHAVRITSEHDDWRRALDARFIPVLLLHDLEERLFSLLDLLRLRMGVVDLRIAEDGTPYFLRVRPQGSFLFLEPLAGLDLVTPFADYLVRLAGGGGLPP